MFTGIITDVGIISEILHNPDMVITVQTHYNTDTIDIGASIACNGICLTVTQKTKDTVQFCLSNETIGKTTAKNWQIGTKLNLERALKMGDELGGHLVTGHVDGIGIIQSINQDQGSLDIQIQTPSDILPYIAPKGSVCCDGISLTVNKVYDDYFHVNIIPHTQQATNWQDIKVGDRINLEIDLMARYMVRYMDFHRNT